MRNGGMVCDASSTCRSTRRVPVCRAPEPRKGSARPARGVATAAAVRRPAGHCRPGHGRPSVGRRPSRRGPSSSGTASVSTSGSWVRWPTSLRCIQASDLVVQPSHFEALGLSAIEALACGVPRGRVRGGRSARLRRRRRQRPAGPAAGSAGAGGPHRPAADRRAVRVPGWPRAREHRSCTSTTS